MWKKGEHGRRFRWGLVKRGTWKVSGSGGGADGAYGRGMLLRRGYAKTSIRERMLRGTWKALVSLDFEPLPGPA